MKLSAPVFVLKKQAKELKKARAITQIEALDQIAQREGFSSWSLLQSQMENALPNSHRQVLGFLKSGDLVLIGGRPAMGKTSFAVGIFVQAIQEIKAKHFFFTLDLANQDLVHKMAGYDPTIGEFSRDFVLDYSDDINADYIIDKTRKEISVNSVVVIDYLQHLDHKRSNPPLQEQVKKLKDYAKEKQCTLIFLSQVHRRVESKPETRPKLEDVKLVNPLDLKLFNKALFLYRDMKHPNELEVLFDRPQPHRFTLPWDQIIR
jgi:replicative DNA helicase